MSISLKMAGQSGFFLIGNIFTLIVGFVFQIYLARVLGAEGLGVFGLLESGVGVFTALLGLGIAQTVMRYIPEHLKKHEFGKVHALVSKGFTILAIFGTAGLVVCMVAIPQIVSWQPELWGYRIEVMVAAMLIPIGLLHFYSSQVLRGFQDIRHIVVGTAFLQLSVKCLLAVVLIGLGYSVLGYLWAVILASLAALAWMFIGIRKHLGQTPREESQGLPVLSEWRGYAQVMYGNNLLNFWSAPLDRFVVGYVAGAGAVGVLIIAKTLYSLPGIFLQMFLSIVAPMMSSAHAGDNQDEVQKIYHLCTDWLVRLSLPLVIFLIIFAEPVLLQFGNSFAIQGVLILQILLIAQLFSLICGPIGNVLNMCGLEKQMFRISITSTVAGAVILIIGVYFWGLPGVGISVLFSVVYSNLYALSVARKELGFYWSDARYIQWILPLTVSVIAALLLSAYVAGPVQLIGSLVVVYIAFHSCQLLVHGLGDEDREIITAIRQKLFGHIGEKK